MAKAAILKSLRVIQTDNFLNLAFDLDGFLVEFKLNNTFYKHVERESFRKDDLNDVAKQVYSGYFQKLEFLEYLAGKRTLYDIQQVSLEKSRNLKYAVKNDDIYVQKLVIKEPYDNFCTVGKYSFKYSGIVEDLFNSDFKIKIPEDAAPPIESKITTLFTTAYGFYNNRKSLIEGFIDENSEKQKTIRSQVALLLSQIAIVIDMINRHIFPMFTVIGPNNLSSFTESQNQEWLNGQILTNPTIENLNNYYLNILGFYKTAYANQLIILESVGIEKLYWLSIGMSAGNLSVLSVKDKISILLLLAKEKLSLRVERIAQEELAIKLVLSFNENNINEIDLFMDQLITVLPDSGSNKTLYESLYTQMSTSTNFKELLLNLTNIVFKTQFKPTSTKGLFVQVVYALWFSSKYNPYNGDRSIKSGTLAFKILDAEQASFSYENNVTPSSLYYYSHETAYEAFPFETSSSYFGPPLNTYKVTRPEAAPIFMPYESIKSLGFYFDNFNFKIEGERILALQTGLAYNYHYGTIKEDDPNKEFPIPEMKELLYGNYHIYQPVTLLSPNLDTKSAFVLTYGDDIAVNGQNINSFIPIFVLAFVDSAGDRSDAQTILGYTLDVATSFIGVGELPQLRHLRWAARGVDTIGLFTIEGLRVVVGGVEFSSGILGVLSNFVECGTGDNFCNSVKSFIMILQLASLSLNTADSLLNFHVKAQAANVIEAAGGGSDEVTIIQNIKNKLNELSTPGSVTDIDDTARAIYRSGYLYSFPANIISELIRNINEIINSQTKTFFLHLDYSKAFLNNFIRLGDKLNLNKKTIVDLVVIANRRKKYISANQLILQTEYFVKEILRRGYSAGFDHLENYKLFCNAFKNRLLINIENLGIDIKVFDEAELVVKGSAVRTWKSGDTDLGIITRPLKEADDIDLGIVLNQYNFNRFCDNLIEVVSKLNIKPKTKTELIESIKFGRSNGNLKYFEVFKNIPIGNSNFSQVIIDAVQPFTRFVPVDGKSKIGFAILLKNGKFDNLPELPFKY